MRSSSVQGLALAAVLAALGCRGGAGTASGGRAGVVRADVAVGMGAAEDAGASAAGSAGAGEGPSTGARFAPRWACRITGPGRTGYGLDGVAVAPPQPGAPAGAVHDAITLRDRGTLAREAVAGAGDAGVAPGRGRVVLRSAAGAEVARREYDVPAGSVEMLFEDERGAGGALWDGRALRLLRAGAAGEEVLAGVSGDATRPCASTPAGALRLVPVSAEPWEFPPVRGMPPSVATARWTLAREGSGLCVARLEGEGPWGKVLLRTPAARELRGDLWLDESLNPVVCGPQ